MDCSEITAGLVAVNCDKASVAGTGSKVRLISYSDINRDLSTVVDGVLTSIVLKATKKAYDFETVDNSVDGDSALVKGTYISDFDHNIMLRVFAKTEAGKKFVNKMKLARVVAVVENKELGTAGEVKYEAYGWDAGLELMEATSTTAMADKVVYEMKLGSGAKSKETTLPKSVFITDLTTTEAMLAALVA